LWANYIIPTPVGSFTLYYTNYYYPYAGIDVFNYKGNGNGAHTMEGGLGFTGQETFPISVAAYCNFYNDIDNSIYVQLSYPVILDSLNSMSVYLGGTPAKSDWYNTNRAAVINIGITVSKTIKITDAFSLPVNASFIINPKLEQSYLVFGMTF
jgi:hypothetical protein